MKYYVYHIQHPLHLNDINEGYIGVTAETGKGVYGRWMKHRKNPSFKQYIKEFNLRFDHIKILFEYDNDLDSYKKEKELRPKRNIGWNIAMGGRGFKYNEKFDDWCNKISKKNSKRMENTYLRKQTGESFKRNYYASEDSKNLRKLRTTEHMQDPDKKKACLSGFHKIRKCPYCNYENNAGNIAIHIKRSHRDVTNNTR